MILWFIIVIQFSSQDEEVVFVRIIIYAISPIVISRDAEKNRENESAKFQLNRNLCFARIYAFFLKWAFHSRKQNTKSAFFLHFVPIWAEHFLRIYLHPNSILIFQTNVSDWWIRLRKAYLWNWDFADYFSKCRIQDKT